MKTVDLRNMTGRVSPKYIDVPQPMVVLHSTAELNKYAPNSIALYSLGEFYQFMKEHNLLRMNTYADVIQLDVWLATNEKFVPDYFTEYDVVMWKLQDGKPIPTDNCYIRLYFILSIKALYLLFTSSGLFAVSLQKYELSAAVKSQFIRTITHNTKTLGDKKHYEANVQRLFDKKTATVRNTRLFYLMFSRESPYFLDPDAAIKVVYGGAIKAKDRKKLIESLNFQKTFLKELEFFMPELKDAFQKNISPDKMVDMAVKIFDKSLEKGDTDDQINAYDLIYRLRENDNIDSMPGNVKLVGDKSTIKKITAGDNGGSVIDRPGVTEIELFDEADILVPKKDAVETTDEPDADAEKKRLEELKEETGALDTTNRKDAL